MRISLYKTVHEKLSFYIIDDRIVGQNIDKNTNRNTRWIKDRISRNARNTWNFQNTLIISSYPEYWTGVDLFLSNARTLQAIGRRSESIISQKFHSIQVSSSPQPQPGLDVKWIPLETGSEIRFSLEIPISRGFSMHRGCWEGRCYNPLISCRFPRWDWTGQRTLEMNEDAIRVFLVILVLANEIPYFEGWGQFSVICYK